MHIHACVWIGRRRREENGKVDSTRVEIGILCDKMHQHQAEVIKNRLAIDHLLYLRKFDIALIKNIMGISHYIQQRTLWSLHDNRITVIVQQG